MSLKAGISGVAVFHGFEDDVRSHPGDQEFGFTDPEDYAGMDCDSTVSGPGKTPDGWRVRRSIGMGFDDQDRRMGFRITDVMVSWSLEEHVARGVLDE